MTLMVILIHKLGVFNGLNNIKWQGQKCLQRNDKIYRDVAINQTGGDISMPVTCMWLPAIIHNLDIHLEM